MRLIDGDKLNSEMYHEAFETDSPLQKWDSGCWIRYKMFENHLKEAPTVDAAPVVHRHWEDVGSLSCRCSGCGCKNDRETRFCPHCGSKMDLEEQHDDKCLVVSVDHPGLRYAGCMDCRVDGGGEVT